MPELDQPGLKVLHVQDIDFETTCFTLVECLAERQGAGRTRNPGHVPIMIQIEAKDDVDPRPRPAAS